VVESAPRARRNDTEWSYAALLASKAATIQKSRRSPIEKAGRYEFVFLIGPNAKQGALLFGADRSTGRRAASRRILQDSIAIARPNHEASKNTKVHEEYRLGQKKQFFFVRSSCRRVFVVDGVCSVYLRSDAR
jgi:hypothetical protein